MKTTYPIKTQRPLFMCSAVIVLSLVVLLASKPSHAQATQQSKATQAAKKAKNKKEEMQGFFCKHTGEAIKKALERQAQTNNGCLSSMFKAPLGTKVCEEVRFANTTGGYVAQDNTVPSFACTTCTKVENSPKLPCGVIVNDSLEVTLEAKGQWTLNNLAGKITVDIKNKSKFLDPNISTALITLTQNETGEEDGYNVVKTVARPSFKYTGGKIISANFEGQPTPFVKGALTASKTYKCDFSTTPEVFVRAVRIERSCTDRTNTANALMDIDGNEIGFVEGKIHHCEHNSTTPPPDGEE